MKKSVIIILLGTMLALNSCVVMKSKYDALESSKRATDKKNKALSTENHRLSARIDSVNLVMSKLLNEYNDVKNDLNENNAKKTSQIDELSTSVSALASDTSKLNQDLRKAIASYNEQSKNLKVLQADMEQKKVTMNGLTKDLEVKEKRLNELEKMIDANKSEVNLLRTTIADALNSFDTTELKVHQKDGKVYVSLEEKLLFKVGSAKVDPKGVKALKEIAKVLEKNPAIDVNIEGHTDNTGTAKINWELSAMRAVSIINLIQENSSIDPGRLIASGRGMYHPVDNANTPDAKLKNRRIEIILTPKLEVLFKLLNEENKK